MLEFIMSVILIIAAALIVVVYVAFFILAVSLLVGFFISGILYGMFMIIASLSDIIAKKETYYDHGENFTILSNIVTLIIGFFVVIGSADHVIRNRDEIFKIPETKTEEPEKEISIE
jgi:hypothetical protein